MSKLEVASAELRMLSGKWQVQAAQLLATTPQQSGLPCQPSAAAVNAAHIAVEAAATHLVDRMTDTASRVTAADINYTANEADSAEKFRAVGCREPK